MSLVYDCSSEDGRAQGLAAAVEAVRDGKVVVLPTDTVYGVGCDAFSPEAVASVLAAKGRGRDMPPPVLVPASRTVDGLATDVPPWARDLIGEFWPGPLTIVFKAHTSLLWDLGETNGTVALRMPEDELALALLAEVGPMAVTSANISGRAASTTAADAQSQLGASVEVYLDDGPRVLSSASTIVDATGEEMVILREGALSAERIESALAAARETVQAPAADQVDHQDDEQDEHPGNDQNDEQDEQPGNDQNDERDDDAAPTARVPSDEDAIELVPPATAPPGEQPRHDV